MLRQTKGSRTVDSSLKAVDQDSTKHLNAYFGEDEALGEDERFLKNYLSSQVRVSHTKLP